CRALATISCRLRRSLGAIAVSWTDGGRELRSCILRSCMGDQRNGEEEREFLHHDVHPRHPSSTSHGLARLAAQQGRPSVARGSTTRHSAMPLRIVVMEGDGIGPEITAATMAVLRAADDIFKLGLSFTPVAIGLAALRAQGTTLPQAAVDAANAA